MVYIWEEFWNVRLLRQTVWSSLCEWQNVKTQLLFHVWIRWAVTRFGYGTIVCITLRMYYSINPVWWSNPSSITFTEKIKTKSKTNTTWSLGHGLIPSRDFLGTVLLSRSVTYVHVLFLQQTTCSNWLQVIPSSRHNQEPTENNNKKLTVTWSRY